ncbi:PH domain-containing protein [Alteromonas sp. MYP5]|uniref:PH domain-containing protein n=1 Tax=Alteromonas ponticola TaxID=2720613 RepID=A0ABX1R4V3_9ALTE|nr:PH domain-containing protein [Alteromonas ponticola]
MEDDISRAQKQHSQIDMGSEWQRLAPISIAYFTASNIKQFAQFLIYVIPALAISSNVFEMHSASYLISAAVGVVSLMSLSGLISYYFYFFRVHNQHIEVKSGVLNRRHINLPFWRIQNVKVEQPFYYRPFKFASVVFDTAGSADEEAKIVAVPLAYAQKLKKHVLANTFDAQNGSPDVPTAPFHANEENEEIVNQRSMKDLIIHGITNNRVWILLGAAAPFYDNASGYVFSWLQSKGLNLDQLLGGESAAWWQVGLYTLTAIVILTALLALLSIGGALLTLYGYTLSRDQDRYIRRSGLLSKQEVSMKQSRIQVITAKQDWLDKLLGRVNLYFEQNTTGTEQHAELMSPSKLLIPSVTVAEVRALVNGAMPDSQIYRIKYKSVSKQFLTFWLGGWIWPLAILLISISAYHQQWQEVGIILAVSIAFTLILILRWWRWGYGYDQRYIYVRSGRMGQDYQCLEKYKVQQISVVQSVFMQRKQIATLKILLASGTVTIPFISEKDAWEMANSALYAAESSRKSWM